MASTWQTHTLEKLTERLNQLQLHVLEKAADVVVSLDRSTGSLETDALDDIGIKCTLQKPFDLALCLSALLLFFLSGSLDLGSLLFEDIDESVADNLALLFGVLDILEAGQEKIRRVDYREVDTKIFVQHLVNLSAFVQAKDTIVNHDGMESRVEMSI